MSSVFMTEEQLTALSAALEHARRAAYAGMSAVCAIRDRGEAADEVDEVADTGNRSSLSTACGDLLRSLDRSYAAENHFLIAGDIQASELPWMDEIGQPIQADWTLEKRQEPVVLRLVP